MIGNDCKILENNIDTFLDVFVKDRNESWESEKTLKLKKILKLYKEFKDLTQDIRSLRADKTRAKTFIKRAELYFQSFYDTCWFIMCTWNAISTLFKKPYW